MKKWIKYLKNKYVIVCLVMLSWLLFFDRNNLIYRYKSEIKLQKLERDKTYYNDQIEQISRKKEELVNDKDKLEKFARENYLMKKEGEDVFIIIEE